MTDSAIDVVYATDSKYLRMTSASIVSLLESQPAGLVSRVFVLSGDTERQKVEKGMRRFLGRRLSSRVHWIGVSEATYENLPIADDTWVSLTTYLRFYATDVLPEDTANLLYLDGDILVRQDLSGLLDVFEKMRENSVAVAARPHPADGYWKKDMKRLGLSSYFNAGVLVIDASLWRERNLPSQLVECSVERRKVIEFADQDTLNLFFKDSYVPLGSEFNFFPNVDQGLDPALVHFIGPFKPSLSRANGSFAKDFQRFVRRTYSLGQLLRHELSRLVRTIMLTDVPPRLPRILQKMRSK